MAGVAIVIRHLCTVKERKRISSEACISKKWRVWNRKLGRHGHVRRMWRDAPQVNFRIGALKQSRGQKYANSRVVSRRC